MSPASVPARPPVTAPVSRETAFQLTIDGREEPHGKRPRTPPPLTPAQLDIVRVARLHNGWIRPAQAGRVIHDQRYASNPSRYATRRGACGSGERGYLTVTSAALACCAYAASDGLAALHRLAKRGIVARLAPGMWTLTEAL